MFYRSVYYHLFFLLCITNLYDACCESHNSIINICSSKNINNFLSFFEKISLQKKIIYNCESDTLNVLNYNIFANKYSKNITAAVKVKIPCEYINTNLCFIGGAKCNNFYNYKKGNKSFAKITPFLGVGIEKAFGNKIKAAVGANCNFNKNSSTQYFLEQEQNNLLKKKMKLSGRVTFTYHTNFDI